MRLTIAYPQKGAATGFELFKALRDSGRFTWVKRTYRRDFDKLWAKKEKEVTLTDPAQKK